MATILPPVVANGGNTTTSKGNYVINTPQNFSFIEENLCRCHFPMNKNHITFLQTLSVNCIINVSGKKLDIQFVTNCDEVGISIINIQEDSEMSQLSRFQEWVVTCLKVILQKCNQQQVGVLLVGSAENFHDCVITSCLRRYQHWSLVSILSEFRHHSWPYKLFDFEQFIEYFNCDSINLSINMPDFITIHDTFQSEENQLLSRCLKHTSEDEGKDKNKSFLNEMVEQKSDNSNSNSADYLVDVNKEGKTTGISGHDNDGNDVHGTSNTEATTSIYCSSDKLVDTKELKEKIPIDEILYVKLFFCPSNDVLSKNIVIDPILSLINEKDEDD